MRADGIDTAVGSALIDRGLVSAEALQAAKRESQVTGRKPGDILVKNGFIRHIDLIETVISISPSLVSGERAFVYHIPAQVLSRTSTMIAAETDDALYVASLSPEAVVASELAEFDARDVHFVPANIDRIDTYLAEVERLQSNSEESWLESMIHRALTGGVSDIHIVPRRETYTVFFRHLGVRQLNHEGHLDEYNVLSARIKDRARMDLSERRVPQDGGFQIEYRGRFVDLRVATVPTVFGEYIIIRILDPESVNIRLGILGITKVDLWRKGVSRADGLCLVCGPTGSGKTTTLNATVKELDRFGRSIFTVEDPVEYNLPYVAQVNINHAVGLDFPKAVRAFMRSDPNIIVLGEVRDEPTARNVVRAAETGHLVLATLHTGSILGAVRRIQDIGVAPSELKYLLRCVLVQRLVRTVCKTCEGKGGECKRCLGSGYGSRTIVSECAYFENEDQVERMMNGERSWISIVEDAAMKCRDGLTDSREIERSFGE